MSTLKSKVKEIVDVITEKEKTPEEAKREVQEHFNKNREYRLALQNYHDTLKKREEALDEREEYLNQCETDMKKMVKDRVLKSLEEEKKKAKKELKAIKDEIKSLEQRRPGLQEAENRIIEWAGRIEKREIDIYNEIQAEANKVQQYELNIDGFEFEKTIAALLAENGYKEVKVTKKSGDFGGDVIAKKEGLKYVFQCKYYSAPVGIKAVQEAHSAKTYYNAHVGVVVTNSIFTKAAKTLAEEVMIILWDREKVSQLLNGK